MACVSDIDLATLHRNRLEERVHYKLSWWARRIITDTQKQLKNHRNVILSGGRSQPRHNGTDCTTRTPATDQRQPSAHQTKSAHAAAKHSTAHRRTADDECEATTTTPTVPALHPAIERRFGQLHNRPDERTANSEQNEREAERRLLENCGDDYFSMERRRRSGTWP